MEQRSTNYGDVAKWIEKVIDSCETYQQTFTVNKLIINFRTQLINSTPDKYWNTYQYEVIWSLEYKLTNKRQSLTNKFK
jgi:hypothetical protein